MLIKQHIKTGDYMFIEFDNEYESVEDSFVDHARLQKKWSDPGLEGRNWVRVRNHMIKTCECDPADIEQMSHAQKWFINEAKLALRSLTKE